MGRQYKSSFLGIRVVILLVTAGVLIIGRQPWPQVLATFAVMQAGAVLGSIWAASLKHRIARNAVALPLERTKL